MVTQVDNIWWQKLAGSMFLPEWQTLGGDKVPVFYVLDLYAPELDRKRILATVTRVLAGFVAQATGAGVPEKDQVLVGARGYRALPRQAVTDYNRTELLRIFMKQLGRKGSGLSNLYVLDLLALGLAVINWLLYPKAPVDTQQDKMYEQMVQDWLRVYAIAVGFAPLP